MALPTIRAWLAYPVLVWRVAWACLVEVVTRGPGQKRRADNWIRDSRRAEWGDTLHDRCGG